MDKYGKNGDEVARFLEEVRTTSVESWRVFVVATHIKSAAMVLAAGDQLPAEHRRALLGPFVAAGFQSVL